MRSKSRANRPPLSARFGRAFARLVGRWYEKRVGAGKIKRVERTLIRLDRANAAFCRLFCSSSAKRNAAVNRACVPTLTADGFLDDQRAQKGFRFGKRAFGINGCGAAALYNVLRALGKPVGLAGLLDRAAFAGLANGRLGLSPVFAVKTLQSEGLSVRPVFDPATFREPSSPDAALIHLYLRADGSAHYASLIAAGGGLFRPLNADVPSRPVPFEAYLERVRAHNASCGSPVVSQILFCVRKDG